MFPIAHNYMTEQLVRAARPPFDRSFSPAEAELLRIGCILPDFVSGMGLDRDRWHEAGRDFYEFCRAQLPEALPLALGAWLHGIDGCGFDTYADEVWQGKMGWCFLKCLPYIPDAVLACNLPKKFALWKAHNLVELAAELELAAAYPELGPKLLQAIQSPGAMAAVCRALELYAGADPERVRPTLQTMHQRFSIVNTSPEDCAQKYLEQLERRHDISGGSVRAMAGLLRQMQTELKPELWQWFGQVEELIQQSFAKIFAI